MSNKPESVVFEHGDELKRFMRNQNKRIEAWIAQNHSDIGLDGPIHKSTVSRALGGFPVVEPVANALDILYSKIRQDPWVWCEPPSDLDNLFEYASVQWWYDVLKPPVSHYRFERSRKFPLEGADRALVQECFDKWRDNLKAACDQYKIDSELVRALEHDESPEYQYWDGLELVTLEHYELAKDDPRGRSKVTRHRVGNAGLLGRTDEEIGMAWALADVVISLPLVDEARLSYTRPNPVSNVEHFSEAIEPWNGQEFEGIEYRSSEHSNLSARGTVRYYWAGDRYKVEDIDPFAHVAEFTGPSEEMEWREPTARERDLLETGMFIDASDTREYLQANRDAIVDEQWERWKDRWNTEFAMKKEYPEGVPRDAVEQVFELRLERADEVSAEKADERREIARRRMAFKRQLRRRV